MPIDFGRLPRAIALVLIALSFASAAMAQTPAPAPKVSLSGLTIAGDVTKPLTLSLAELKTMPRMTVTADEQGRPGRPVKYEGVLVSELLTRAGAPMGRGMGGNGLLSYVRAVAGDGYEVLFSLGELDANLTSNDIIVADTADGKPLFDYQGPLRIVAPHDKRGARSIRMVVRLEVVRLQK
jgi:DMSO/TMAO reductase YedYZ molybdopterin-dependent catalytic subunit